MTGTWEFTNAKTARSCRVHLGDEAGLHGRQLGAPPACRAALPLLGQAAGWNLEGARVTMVDASGKKLVSLEREANGPGFASAAEGLTLKPLGQARAPAAEPVHTAAGPAATHAPKAGGGVAAPPPPPASVAPNVTPQSLAGLYGVAREKNKPICSIDLILAQGRKEGRMPAKLSGGCIDSGLKVFDPVGWRTGNGRLYLVAKKGHEQGFSVMPDGTWQKDPVSGAQLYLKKQ
ncbi:AprI/Inh family metalloprotease inhibitor [Alsobacter soli]|nr:AprI/Inh family metalloprotease inhibitor [Alsobacter soli]